MAARFEAGEDRHNGRPDVPGPRPAGFRPPRLPHLHRLVSAGAGQALAVGAEGHALDSAGVALEGEDLPARERLPHLHRVVIRGAGQAFAIGEVGIGWPEAVAAVHSFLVLLRDRSEAVRHARTITGTTFPGRQTPGRDNGP